jgi:DnaK suppressor protein
MTIPDDPDDGPAQSDPTGRDARDRDVRDRIEAARDRARRRDATLSRDLDDIMTSTLDANSDDEHDPEGATIAFERAQVTELLRTTRVELAALDAAMARLEAGTYGRCLRCGRDIAPARLAARPAATTCIDCA